MRKIREHKYEACGEITARLIEDEVLETIVLPRSGSRRHTLGRGLRGQRLREFGLGQDAETLHRPDAGYRLPAVPDCRGEGLFRG